MARLRNALLIALLTGAAGGAWASGGGGMGGGDAPSVSAPSYDPAAEYARAVSALREQGYKTAARAAERVTSAAPTSVEGWRLLGAAQTGAENWKAARRAYERAVKLAPDDALSHGGLGLALAKLQDARAQQELAWLKAKLEACAAGCSDAADLQALAGQVEAAMTPAQPQPAAALAPGDSLLFAGPAIGDALYAGAVGLINQRRYDEALGVLDRARAVFGPHPDILTYQGYAWRKKGDFARAEAYYRQALALAPRHRGATEYYGELKVEQGDLPGARRLLARLDHLCVYGCAEAEELRLWVANGRDPRT